MTSPVPNQPDLPAECLSYINYHSILGMCSKNYKISFSYESIYTRKNKNNITLFYPFTKEQILSLPEKNVNLSYLLEPEYKEFQSYNIPYTKYKSSMVLSKIDKEFLTLSGKKWTEMRETRNKYDKIITIKIEPNDLNEINTLIDLWDNKSGSKYGWQRHSGYDRAFFNLHWTKEKDNLYSYFFYIENKLVGYSVVSKLGNQYNFSYVIRKNDVSYRNLCLYIDFKTFSLMFDDLQKDFVINWGAASKNILKYKEKFPLYKKIDVYFVKVKNERT